MGSVSTEYTGTPMGGSAYGYGGMGIAPFGLFGAIGLDRLGLGGAYGAGAAYAGVSNDTLSARFTDSQIAGLGNEVVAANYQVLSQLTAGQNALSQNMATNTQNVLLGQANVKDSVQNLAYEGAILNLQGQNSIERGLCQLGNQTAMQTFELNNATKADGDATRQLINDLATQQLRDENLALKNELALTLRVGPEMVGGFQVSQRPSCGSTASNTDIINVNNNINAIGSKVDQLTGVLSSALTPTA